MYLFDIITAGNLLLNRLAIWLFTIAWNWTWINFLHFQKLWQWTMCGDSAQHIASLNSGRRSISSQTQLIRVIFFSNFQTKTKQMPEKPNTIVFNTEEKRHLIKWNKVIELDEKNINEWIKNDSNGMRKKIQSHYSSSHTIGFPSLGTHLNKSAENNHRMNSQRSMNILNVLANSFFLALFSCLQLAFLRRRWRFANEEEETSHVFTHSTSSWTLTKLKVFCAMHWISTTDSRPKW